MKFKKKKEKERAISKLQRRHTVERIVGIVMVAAMSASVPSLASRAQHSASTLRDSTTTTYNIISYPILTNNTQCAYTHTRICFQCHKRACLRIVDHSLPQGPCCGDHLSNSTIHYEIYCIIDLSYPPTHRHIDTHTILQLTYIKRVRSSIETFQFECVHTSTQPLN